VAEADAEYAKKLEDFKNEQTAEKVKLNEVSEKYERRLKEIENERSPVITPELIKGELQK